jgi:hypothetical protein
MSDKNKEDAQSDNTTTPEDNTSDEILSAHINSLIDLEESGLPFTIWGSWAVQFQERDYDYTPSDIDIQILKSDIDKWLEYLSSLGYRVDLDIRPGRIIAFRERSIIDAHLVIDEGEYLVDEYGGKNFYYPKSGYREVDFGDMPIKIMGPELSLLQENAGAERQTRAEKIAQLNALSDESKLKEISQLFKVEEIDHRKSRMKRALFKLRNSKP